jgi:predicted glutamine amidotransferase
MCLLVTQSKSSPVLSDALLTDFYDANSDGVGVMFANGGDLVIKKIIPKNAAEFIQFYRADIQGRDCAFHLRMRTHGEIDLINCHPYEVLNRAEHGIDLWLMHNGVLSTGNRANVKLSDTWHYINDYLKPMLTGNPDFAFHPAFKADRKSVV